MGDSEEVVGVVHVWPSLLVTICPIQPLLTEAHRNYMILLLLVKTFV